MHVPARDPGLRKSHAGPLGGQPGVLGRTRSRLSPLTARAVRLTPVPGSPFPAGGFPVSVTVDPTGQFVYAANVLSNDVSAYRIDQGTGALTPISGSPFPAGLGAWSVAVDPTGQFAYVSNCGQPTCTDPNSPGTVSAYTIDPNTGALTPVPGSPFPAGARSDGMTVDPTGRFVYVTNRSSNDISAFAIDATTGALTPIAGSPFAAGVGAIWVAVDPTGQFAYVANCGSFCLGGADSPGSVSVYVIDSATGALIEIAGSPFPCGISSAYVTIDWTGQFVYVGNRDSNDISAFALDATSGGLTPVPGSPFAAGSGPIGIATTAGPQPPAPLL